VAERDLILLERTLPRPSETGSVPMLRRSVPNWKDSEP
jgi:hypothetical protein